MQCEFVGCELEAEPGDYAMALCTPHAEEFGRAIVTGPGAMLAFWVRARGGAAATARHIAGLSFGRALPGREEQP